MVTHDKAMKKLLPLYMCVMVALGCQPEPELLERQPGEADLSNYIAIGNSLTAGVSNGGLYLQGQLNSYPVIIAQQFAEITEIDFHQPLLPEGNGSGFMYIAGFSSSGATQIGTRSADPAYTTKITGDFNNLGIPGLRLKDITDEGYGQKNRNPFFYRIISSGKEQSTSYLQVAAASSPSFFTCWIGTNDVLDYALTGGIFGVAGKEGTGLYGITDPQSEFASSYQLLIASLTENGAKGVLATIPDITISPFFTAVPYNAIKLDEKAAVQANAAYKEYNSGVNQAYAAGLITKKEMEARTIRFAAGQNPIVIDDEILTDLWEAGLPSLRQLKHNERVLLEAQRVLGTLKNPADSRSVIGVDIPLPEQYELTLEEMENIARAIAGYNEIITYIALSHPDLALMRADDLWNQVKDGIFVDGIPVNGNFITGGFYSLDGIHLTPRGYALIANKFIDTINQEFGASVGRVAIGSYKGVETP